MSKADDELNDLINKNKIIISQSEEKRSDARLEVKTSVYEKLEVKHNCHSPRGKGFNNQYRENFKTRILHEKVNKND